MTDAYISIRMIADSPARIILRRREHLVSISLSHRFGTLHYYLLSTSPLVGQESGREDVGQEGERAVHGGQSEDHVAVDPEPFEEDGCAGVRKSGLGKMRGTSSLTLVVLLQY